MNQLKQRCRCCSTSDALASTWPLRLNLVRQVHCCSLLTSFPTAIILTVLMQRDKQGDYSEKPLFIFTCLLLRNKLQFSVFQRWTNNTGQVQSSRIHRHLSTLCSHTPWKHDNLQFDTYIYLMYLSVYK